MSTRVVVEVYICQSDRCRLKSAEISQNVFALLEGEDVVKSGYLNIPEVLQGHVVSIRLQCAEATPCWKVTFELFQYVQNSDVSSEQLEDEDATPAFHQFDLPHESFENLWETLHFDSHLKQDLLGYAGTSLLFSSRGVDNSVISCNRMVLLYGPPGTGKTTLCKAIAQRLSIKQQKRFPHSVFVEINAHSLFSKWFSESGKQIQKLFAFLEDLVADEDTLVSIQIDEVESQALSRAGAIASNEPADSVRAVNALLTQLDKLSRKPNVQLLTTTNITGALDAAFLDRADMRRYVGPPGMQGRYQILSSCITELQEKNVLTPTIQPEYTQVQDQLRPYRVNINLKLCNLPNELKLVSLATLIELYDSQTSQEQAEPADLLLWVILFSQEELHREKNTSHTLVIPQQQEPTISKSTALLLSTALLATNMSGRTLRKLPFQAYAYGDAQVTIQEQSTKLTMQSLLQPTYHTHTPLTEVGEVQRLDLETQNHLIDTNEYLFLLAYNYNINILPYKDTSSLLKLDTNNQITINKTYQLPRPKPFEKDTQGQVSTEAFLNTLRYSVNQRACM